MTHQIRRLLATSNTIKPINFASRVFRWRDVMKEKQVKVEEAQGRRTWILKTRCADTKWGNAEEEASQLGTCTPNPPRRSSPRRQGRRYHAGQAESRAGSRGKSRCRREPCDATSPALCRYANGLDSSDQAAFYGTNCNHYFIAGNCSYIGNAKCCLKITIIRNIESK